MHLILFVFEDDSISVVQLDCWNGVHLTLLSIDAVVVAIRGLVWIVLVVLTPFDDGCGESLMIQC